MSIHRHLSIGVLLLGTMFCCGDTPNLKTYVGHAGEYSVKYPDTWVHYPPADSLYILNFPLDRIRREVLLPDHGAMITFVERKPRPKSLGEWIETDIKRRGVDQRRDFVIDLQGQAAKLMVWETISHSSRGSYEFEEVNWYFSIAQHFFDASLLYYRGDIQSEEYRDVLRLVVSSVKVN